MVVAERLGKRSGLDGSLRHNAATFSSKNLHLQGRIILPPVARTSAHFA